MTWEIEKVVVTVRCAGHRGTITFEEGPSRSILRVLTQHAVEQIGETLGTEGVEDWEPIK